MSILLYGSQVWFPSLTYHRKLELFNRKCLKWVTGVNDYTEQLRKTNSLPISFTMALEEEEEERTLELLYNKEPRHQCSKV